MKEQLRRVEQRARQMEELPPACKSNLSPTLPGPAHTSRELLTLRRVLGPFKGVWGSFEVEIRQVLVDMIM